ncbi:MAG: DUF6090 family protein [Saprospiraceae bacterium]
MRLNLFRRLQEWNWQHFFAELSLITVGVLIALAINNWSNRVNETKKEAFHLQDLRQSLYSDLNELKSIMQSHQESRRSCEILYQHLLAGKPWNDSFPGWIQGTTRTRLFFPQRAAFENLKSLDFNLIKNDQLRASIFQTYEERFEQVRVSEQKLIQQVNEYWIPLLSSKVRMMENFSIEPVNYDAILHEPPYRNYLGMIHGNNDEIILDVKIAAMNVALLIRQIDLELQKIKSRQRRTQKPRSIVIQTTDFQSAKNIIISGSFNDWNQTQYPLQKTKDGWQTTLPLKPGVYMYKFIVDGEWTEDPANTDRILSEYDTYNSILIVK